MTWKAETIAGTIDHTLLKPTMLAQQVEQLCGEAQQFKFAAVCVPPPFVKLAKLLMPLPSDPRVATVIGFPFGYSAIESKLAEVVLAMVDGADELDMVINYTALKNNDWEYLANEINHILPIVHGKGKLLKLIIESGILTDEEIIRCCEMYGAAGVDFLKTSTGYAEKHASVEAVKLMRTHLPPQVRIKASGGIRNQAFAIQLLEAGASRLGTSSGLALIQNQNGKADY